MTISDLPPDPPTDLEGPPMPSLVSGTSREFMGNKPLPRAIRDRPMVFILGPAGVGKTSVARVLAGSAAIEQSEQDVLSALSHHARHRSWQSDLLETQALVLECPCFLNRRPAALERFKELLRLRAGGGRCTWVVEAESGTGMEAVMGAVHPGYRATVLLRFPIGRGRLRFARRVCDELGISARHASETTSLDPWTYARVRAVLADRN
jgi:hypothetical protein